MPTRPILKLSVAGVFAAALVVPSVPAMAGTTTAPVVDEKHRNPCFEAGYPRGHRAECTRYNTGYPEFPSTPISPPAAAPKKAPKKAKAAKH